MYVASHGKANTASDSYDVDSTEHYAFMQSNNYMIEVIIIIKVHMDKVRLILTIIGTCTTFLNIH